MAVATSQLGRKIVPSPVALSLLVLALPFGLAALVVSLRVVLAVRAVLVVRT